MVFNLTNLDPFSQIIICFQLKKNITVLATNISNFLIRSSVISLNEGKVDYTRLILQIEQIELIWRKNERKKKEKLKTAFDKEHDEDKDEICIMMHKQI